MFTKPTLILDEAKCRENIEFMANKAKRFGIDYRPHFKTHQSREVGQWFKDYGVTKIAVSSVPMAQYFAADGWDDITIAFPFVKQQADTLNGMAGSIHLNLVASSLKNAEDIVSAIIRKVNVLIEIDAGQGRTGLQPYDLESIDSIIKLLDQLEQTEFTGFLTHAGHSYGVSARDLMELNNQTISRLLPLKERYSNAIISYGDTPTSTICEQFLGIDELRPGNNVFFDMQQASNGICSTEQIAVGLACPVVACYPERNLVAIWGGAVHLSKDFFIDANGNKSFGAICRMNNDGSWGQPIDGLSLESISQEHGMIRATRQDLLQLISEDDFLVVLPAHSCLTVDNMGAFWVSGKGYLPTMVNGGKSS
jgi:D-serine deaminase-like pyridoxal phosphate-dependent protein